MASRLPIAFFAALSVAAASAAGGQAASPDCAASAYLGSGKQVFVVASCTATTSAIVIALPSSSARAGTIRRSLKGARSACRVQANVVACAARIPAGQPFRVDLTASHAPSLGAPLRLTVRFSSGRTLTLQLLLVAPPGDDG